MKKLVIRVVSIAQEFSLPLIAGVFCALFLANTAPELYHHLVHWHPGGLKLLGHDLTLHFVINDIFMVAFFGIAAKEITEACLPGGSLNPPKKAANPLFGTLGGVLGPVGVYFLLTYWLYQGHADYDTVWNGWGIPTATDIALAWLLARMIFGKHPAVDFLLLLAVADDAIGLGIIAVFYPDPAHPVAPQWLVLNAVAMLIAYGFRRWSFTAKWWVPTIVVAGSISWLGLMLAHLHPALALVPIVPFLPPPSMGSAHLFDEEDYDEAGHLSTGHGHGHSPLTNFEHRLKFPVDFGLFGFALCNAGVAFSSMNEVTWIVLASLVVGKTLGIGLCSWVAEKLGFPLPAGMTLRHLAIAGLVAGLGLTVALFVSGEAFPGSSPYQGPAKMGAVFSGLVFFVALPLARLIGIKPAKEPLLQVVETPSHQDKAA